MVNRQIMGHERKEWIADFIKAVNKRHPMIADNLGLALTLEELEEIYTGIGKHYERERMFAIIRMIAGQETDYAL